MNQLQNIACAKEFKHACNNVITVERFSEYEKTKVKNEAINRANVAIQSFSCSLSLAIECLKSLSENS